RLMQGEKLAAIGEMAATIAHELKGPLVSIGGFARRLARKIPQSTPEGKAADTIVKEALRLEKMLSDILSYARKPSLCYSPCDLREIMEDSLRLVMPSLEECGIAVTTLYREVPTFMGDFQQLKQLFLNLLLNAQEAMRCGGRLDASIEPASLGGLPAVAVTIADTGSGVPVELLNSIFNPFFTTKPHGTGLGLPIVHRIVTNHGGKIEVRNRAGGGAEFRVLLPAGG
ncbi:MAG TPA: ATP-binding protein, partial [Verrucomicrobiae bacterium]|nr:ATP-binding protein [Verrucomicrobiae bacterium]